jgi:methylated-DNA-[protein]-cysteine S-methyltransferase
MQQFFKWIDSPIGPLKLVASDNGLMAILWKSEKRRWRHLDAPQIESDDHPVLRQAEEELTEYFAGARKTFDVPLDLDGTDFQKSVWRKMLGIAYGSVLSYGEIARAIGNPNAVRAVGSAVGMNPIAIMAPCHRVLGSSGTLTGFAGGLEAKKGLLKIEQIAYRNMARGPMIDKTAKRLEGVMYFCVDRP